MTTRLKKATATSIVIRNISGRASQCYYKKLDGFKSDDLVFWADYFDILRESGKINNGCSIIKRQYNGVNKIIVEFWDKKEAVKAFSMVDQYLHGVDDED